MEFVTQKTLETKHKALNKHYYKFYIIAWSDGNTCIAEPNLEVLPLITCFIIVSLLHLEGGQEEYPWCSFDL